MVAHLFQTLIMKCAHLVLKNHSNVPYCHICNFYTVFFAQCWLPTLLIVIVSQIRGGVHLFYPIFINKINLRTVGSSFSQEG